MASMAGDAVQLGSKVEREEFELPLRVVLIEPPPGARFCLQRGKTEHVQHKVATSGEMAFDFTVRALTGSRSGPVRFLGPYTQGPPAARFVYICSGTLADQPESIWTRRIKLPLSSITTTQVEQILRGEGSRLEARIAGRARDGGPACATVPLLGGGWKAVR